MILLYVSQSLLYVCFTVLFGGLLFSLVPENKQPEVQVPQNVMLACLIGIAVFTYAPIVRLILIFGPDVGYWLTFKSVMLTFEEGRSYLIVLLLSILVFVFMKTTRIKENPNLIAVSLLFVVFMVTALGYSSHVASQTNGSGFIAQTLHYLSVVVWGGILLTVAWFSKRKENWLIFIRWFSPIAFTCVIIISISGLFMMTIVVPEYFNSWILSYGQALLIKHLLFIPLIAMACINGFLIRKRLVQDPSYHPLSWIRVESIIAIVVFMVTGFMGQQPPPHKVALTLVENKPSQLFLAFYQEKLSANPALNLNLNSLSIILAIAAVLLLISIFTFFSKKAFSIYAVISSIGFCVTAYLSLMIALI
ncbi:copper resistance D family protein [Paenibacillus qinlingensis]|uniref:copper resistance D family protein n=1 Tax=Paenibacillus qinlingensis TaxID=1837343 RepID=UPI00156635F7|nr:CopD family protein [Paenibacillus qinlingensis]NQX62392.1 CopD family protein [Paenibacillus qinlingensis]